jgi:hypothetical protein
MLNELILNYISKYIENKDLHCIYKITKLLLPIIQYCYLNLNYYYSNKYYENLEFRNRLVNLIKYPNKNLSLDLFLDDITDLSTLCNIHSIKVILTDGFNQPINNLPESITYLLFVNNFNQPIDNLVNSITHL